MGGTMEGMVSTIVIYFILELIVKLTTFLISID
jgi:hypothetical protein